MKELIFETDQGGFGFVGRLHGGAPRPALLAITGAFPPEGHLHELVDRFAGVNVLVGQFSLIRREPIPTLDRFHAELDRFAARMFGEVPLVTLGVSTGCLFTLGMQAPNLFRHVALEPFFSTADLWPFIANSRERLERKKGDAGIERFLRELFGITREGVVNRDYRRLISGLAAPTAVIAADMPLLPERETAIWPSFLSEPERALLRASGKVVFHDGPPGSGHDLEGSPAGRQLIDRVLSATLREAASATPRARWIGVGP